MDLFSAYRLGPLELPNRVVMAPMTRSRSIGNVPGDLTRSYYEQRASAGLIITEGIAPSPDGLGYARIPGLYSPAQIAGFRAVTDAVHAAGGRIFAQLMHVGRITHPSNMPVGARALAPSAVGAAGSMWTDEHGPQPMPVPEAMSSADVQAAREAFAQASRNAIAAGFDGVELHGANGYLLEQFLHPHTNRRSDHYGGDVGRRIRFVVETARAAAHAIGAERVGIRLSPHGTFNDLPPYPEVHATYAALAEALEGLLYVHLVGSTHADYADTARAIRAAFKGTVIHNGGFDGPRAREALARGDADLIAFGRPFIANPDLVERLRRGAPLAAPDPATFYSAGAEGYVDYPALPPRAA
jgi:N-ethylmaleimide reductase